jgi:hypothetical protein
MAFYLLDSIRIAAISADVTLYAIDCLHRAFDKQQMPGRRHVVYELLAYPLVRQTAERQIDRFTNHAPLTLDWK